MIYSVTRIAITPENNIRDGILFLHLCVSGIKSEAERKMKDPAVMPSKIPKVDVGIFFNKNMPTIVPIGVKQAVRREKSKILLLEAPLCSKIPEIVIPSGIL
jgi:hypothetical protein